MRRKKIKLHGISSGVFYENLSNLRLGKIREDYFDSTQLDGSRFYFFFAGAVVVLLLFLGRLFNLTVIAGEKNRELSENNRIRIVEVEAQRGKKLERRGRLLA